MYPNKGLRADQSTHVGQRRFLADEWNEKVVPFGAEIHKACCIAARDACADGCRQAQADGHQWTVGQRMISWDLAYEAELERQLDTRGI